MLSRKCSSGILVALLALNLSLLVFPGAVKPANAAPDPWEMPVVYVQAIPLTSNILRVHVAVYNLTNTFYPSDEMWVEGGPLPPYAPGPVTRFNYSLGNLYGFDLAISWNPAVLSYLSHVATVPRRPTPQPFGANGILDAPIMLAYQRVDPVAGTYRITYASLSPALGFNVEENGATVFTMLFTVLDAGDYGLSLDLVDLVLDPRFWGSGYNIGVQPEIPWRAVLAPAFAANVGVDAAPRNKDVVGEGKPFDTYALVKNTGATAETFNVTIYANATPVGTASATVAAGTQQTVKIRCSAAGLAKGPYALKAVAAAVAGETYLSDNELLFGSIFVTLAGDIDGDRCVDIFNIVAMAQSYGATGQAGPRYNPYPDLDNNYTVNIFDIVIAASNYGKCW